MTEPFRGATRSTSLPSQTRPPEAATSSANARATAAKSITLVPGACSAQAAHVRLDLAQLIRVEEPQPLDAVRPRPLGECRQPAELALLHGDDELAAARKRDPALRGV